MLRYPKPDSLYLRRTISVLMSTRIHFQLVGLEVRIFGVRFRGQSGKVWDDYRLDTFGI